MRGMRRLLVTAVVALPAFLVLSWWNAFVGVVFGIAAITWILSSVYFASGGRDSELGEGQSREERHRDFFE